ncbi:MAG: MATE family efflux transporter [Treponema sp.]|nr:MATE family efflux transporter [Treponema sp.]
MIGTEGELAVAAVGICALFFMLLFAMFFGFGHGGMIFFAQYWGAKDEKGICRAYGLTLVCVMSIGLIFGGLAVFAPEFIMGIYTDKESIKAIGIQYLRIVGWSYPLQTMAIVMGFLLRSIEKVRIPLYASVISLLTNTFFNWVLIFGRLGFPKMGVRGAATGTVIAQVVHVLVIFAYCLNDKHSFITRIRDHFKWNIAFVKVFFSKIIFVVVGEILYGTGNLILNMIMGRQAETGLAAWAVFRVLEGFIFAFFIGLSSASSVMVGKKIGAGEHLEGYTNAKRFALLCPIVTFTICISIILARSPILHCFNLGEEAFRYAQGMLFIFAITGTMRTCNYICNNIFRAGGAPVLGTVLEGCGLYFICIPSAAIAGFVFHWPFLAVFFMMYLDEFIRLAVSLWYMNSGRWIKPVTDEGKASLAEFKSAYTALKN